MNLVFNDISLMAHILTNKRRSCFFIRSMCDHLCQFQCNSVNACNQWFLQVTDCSFSQDTFSALRSAWKTGHLSKIKLFYSAFPIIQTIRLL